MVWWTVLPRVILQGRSRLCRGGVVSAGAESLQGRSLCRGRKCPMAGDVNSGAQDAPVGSWEPPGGHREGDKQAHSQVFLPLEVSPHGTYSF